MLFQPLWWEYIWCISLILSFLGLDAIKKNRVAPMRHYMFGLILFGFFPLVYAIIYYFSDVWTYLTLEDEELENIHMWQVKINNMLIHINYLIHCFNIFQEYPYGLLWYAFILLALQVHSFSLYFAWNLITAWRSKGTKKFE